MALSNSLRRTIELTIHPVEGTWSAVDHLAEARRERELAAQADEVLTDTLSGIESLVGRTIGWELNQRTREAQNPLGAACDRYEQAIAVRDERIATLEAEVERRVRICQTLGQDLTAEMNRRAEETSTALAALACLSGAVSWAKARTKKKARPGWLTASVELLDKLEVET